MSWQDMVTSVKNFFTGKRAEVKAAEDKERLKAKELLDHYSGNQVKYIEGVGFEDLETGKDIINKMTLNITRKIIDKVSMVYKYPPERTLVDKDGEELKKDGQAYAQWINYVEVFDNHITEAERQKNLFHKILWRTHFNPVTKKWKFLIEWDYKAHFVDGDPLNPVGFSVPIVVLNENLDYKHRVSPNEQIYLYYDDINYFYYNTKGETWTYFTDYNGVRQDNDGKNIYGISPFVELRKGVPVYQYDTLGAQDLISANRAINQNLNNLNMALHYQGFGMIWDNSGLDKEAGKEILVGPNRQTHVAEGVTLNNLDLNPKLMEMIDTIKFEVQAIANTYNLTVNWHQEATPVSGFSLIVQNMDYIEQRQKDVDEAIKQEKQIYKTIKSIQVVHKSDLEKDEPRLPDKANLVIDFQELDLPINQVEELARRKADIEDNIKTPIDFIKAENPDMDEEAAKKKFLENKAINSELSESDKIRENIKSLGGAIVE
jgi:hypothetical protein